MRGTVTIDCPAKLNLALAVDPPDPQDPLGLHPIASWMAALSLADRLVVERVDHLENPSRDSAFRLSFAADAPSPREIDWPLADDLAVRAHALVEQKAGRKLPVSVDLQKRIPTGAGLGGGSSDAAGMIVALDRLFDLGLGPQDHHELAAALGSDVHFALAALAGADSGGTCGGGGISGGGGGGGGTSAIVSGSGDRVEPAPQSEAWPIDLVLVLPPFGCPTGPVYAAFDRLTRSKPPIDLDGLRELARGFTPSTGELFNDLTDAAVAVQPRLESLLGELRQVSPLPVHVTGSGAACFMVADSAAQAQHLAETLAAKLGVVALATRTI